MRISSVTPHHLRIPNREDGRDLFLVAIEGDALVSWGEAYVDAPDELVAAVDLLEPILVDADPLSRGLLWERCALRLAGAGVAPFDGLGVLAAVDVALWDLAGRALDVPCWKLSGGPHFAMVDACVTETVGADAGAAVRRAAKAAKTGITAVRLEIGADPTAGVETAHALRRSAGAQLRIIADAGGFIGDLAQARAIADGLAQADVLWAEDLLGGTRFSDWAVLCRETLVPVAGGKLLFRPESVLQCLGAGGVEILTPDLRCAGGPTAVARLVDLARVHGARAAVWPGLTPISILAAIHLALASPNAVPMLPAPDSRYGGMLDTEIPITDGVYHRPEGPGLGATVSERFVERFEVELPEVEEDQ